MLAGPFRGAKCCMADFLLIESSKHYCWPYQKQWDNSQRRSGEGHQTPHLRSQVPSTPCQLFIVTPCGLGGGDRVHSERAKDQGTESSIEVASLESMEVSPHPEAEAGASARAIRHSEHLGSAALGSPHSWTGTRSFFSGSSHGEVTIQDGVRVLGGGAALGSPPSVSKPSPCG